MAKQKKTVTGRVLHDPVKDKLRPIFPENSPSHVAYKLICIVADYGPCASMQVSVLQKKVISDTDNY